MTRRTARLLALLLAPLLASCGSGGEAPSHAAPVSPVPSAATGSPDPGGSPLVLTDVRLLERGDRARVVLDFSGAGRPGWAATYVAEAVLEGSGDVVRLAGDAILDVHASGTTWPAPDYYEGPRRLRGDGPVPEVYVAGTFEGDTQVFVGVADGAPYDVGVREHPSRLVIDVG